MHPPDPQTLTEWHEHHTIKLHWSITRRKIPISTFYLWWDMRCNAASDVFVFEHHNGDTLFAVNISIDFFSSLLLIENEQAPASMPFHKSSTSHLYLVSSPHMAQWKEKWHPWGCLWLFSWSCLTFTAHNSIKLWGLLRNRACSLMCNTNKCTLSVHAQTYTHAQSQNTHFG